MGDGRRSTQTHKHTNRRQKMGQASGDDSNEREKPADPGRIVVARSTASTNLAWHSATRRATHPCYHHHHKPLLLLPANPMASRVLFPALPCRAVPCPGLACPPPAAGGDQGGGEAVVVVLTVVL